MLALWLTLTFLAGLTVGALIVVHRLPRLLAKMSRHERATLLRRMTATRRP